MYKNLMYELDVQTIFDILNCTKCKFQYGINPRFFFHFFCSLMYENLMYELDVQTIFDILNCTKCKFQYGINPRFFFSFFSVV